MGQYQDRARHRARAGARGKTISRYKRVALVGFMGAGKTTVGRLLAPMLGWRFLDTDALLVEQHGASIASLFEQFGEPRFREWEAEIVASALAEDQVVIALGGGAIEHFGTRELLFGESATLTVFLETPLPVALARCAAEPGATVRPVLADAARLHHRYATRLPLYRSACLILPTEMQTPAALAHAIAGAVQPPGSGDEFLHCRSDHHSVQG